MTTCKYNLNPHCVLNGTNIYCYENCPTTPYKLAAKIIYLNLRYVYFDGKQTTTKQTNNNHAHHT
ncbi:MAG: hypothetical protein LBP59_12290 [Planctomycetaceae bacterium]|nr:hypothetical protein [Planctomycetaceae bacterium]